jgi:hypothetical protein
LTVAFVLVSAESGSAETGPAKPIARIALESIAAMGRKFDRVGREYVVVIWLHPVLDSSY